MHTAEQFRTYISPSPDPADAEPFGPGELFELVVQPDYQMRHIWLAAGSWRQQGLTDEWYVFGRLDFYLQGQVRGQFHFCDASSYILDATRDAAPKAITRIRPDGNGSTQPTLRFDYDTGGAYHRDNLDLSCFSFRVPCDRVRYVVEKTFTNGTINQCRLVLGCKIVSTL